MFSKDRRAKTIKRIIAAVFSTAMLVSMLTGVCFAADSAAANGQAAPGGGSSILIMVFYLVIIAAVFYFMMIRPEKKRKKKAEDMRNSITIGDNITTIGGIVGKVVNVSNEFITFETGEDRVRIKITKWGVSSTGKDTSESADKAGE